MKEVTMEDTEQLDHKIRKLVQSGERGDMLVENLDAQTAVLQHGSKKIRF